MYKGKDFGTPFKKRGATSCLLKKFQLGVGTSMRCTAPRAARLRHIVTCDGKAREAGACDILSHWHCTPEGGATSCHIDSYLLDTNKSNAFWACAIAPVKKLKSFFKHLIQLFNYFAWLAGICLVILKWLLNNTDPSSAINSS